MLPLAAAVEASKDFIHKTAVHTKQQLDDAGYVNWFFTVDESPAMMVLRIKFKADLNGRVVGQMISFTDEVLYAKQEISQEAFQDYMMFHIHQMIKSIVKYAFDNANGWITD